MDLENGCGRVESGAGGGASWVHDFQHIIWDFEQGSKSDTKMLGKETGQHRKIKKKVPGIS